MSILKIIDNKLITYDSINDEIIENGKPTYLHDRTNASTERDLCIELTNRCNLKCKNCFCSLGKESISLGVFEELITKYANRVIRICLSGGEPLLNKNILPIIDYLNTIPNLGKVLSTNGILLNEEILFRLKEPLWTVAVSLHGNKQTHNDYVGKDVYDKVIFAIKRLSEEHINTHIYTVLHNQITRSDIFSIKEVKQKYDVSVLRLIKIRQHGKYQKIVSPILKNVNEYLEKGVFYKNRESKTFFVSAKLETRNTK